MRRQLGVTWPALGFLASAVIAAAATRLLSHRPTAWWWRVPLLHGHGTAWHFFWAGVILLCVAWLGVGRRLARLPAASELRPRHLAAVGALWSLPLALGPALFSLDLYSYLAQGAILWHGLNPYHSAPRILARWHETSLLSTVSTSWRATTAPYGPTFVGLAALAAALAGGHLTVGVTLLRLPELAGIALLAGFVPRLARSLGADPLRAVWLAMLSPLTLLYLVGGGHNDGLMAGLMVAGVALALEQRLAWALALCALAATVKLPAAAAFGAVVICWLRADPGQWRRVIGISSAVAAAVVLVAGLITGVGLTWISGNLFSTPEMVRTALTPATAAAIWIYGFGHHLGTGVLVAARSFEDAATLVAFGVTAAVGLWLLVRMRWPTLTRYLGVILLVAALGGPAAWPWYLSWGLVLVAADPRGQRSWWLPLALVASAFPVMAGGQVAVPLPHAVRMLAVYAVAGAVAAAGWLWRRRAPRPAGSVSPVPSSSVASVDLVDPSPVASSELVG